MYVEQVIAERFGCASCHFASRLGKRPLNRPLALICQSGAQSPRAAQVLAQAGIVDLDSIQCGTDARVASGLKVERHDLAEPAFAVVETEWAHTGRHSVAGQPVESGATAQSWQRPIRSIPDGGPPLAGTCERGIADLALGGHGCGRSRADGGGDI
jgi:hypothetical protein